MIVILTDGATSRHRYIFGYLLHTYCGIDCRFQEVSSGEIISPGCAIISYLDLPIAGTFHIRPCGILSASGIPEEPEVVNGVGSFPYFYSSPHADFPFDVFGAAFYLLSRAEEYHGHPSDVFGRFHHIHSMAFRNGWLDLPLIDLWMADFRNALALKFPTLAICAPVFEFHPTYDIDIAWAFRGRSWSRSLLGLARSLFYGKFREVTERLNVIRGDIPDPYDCYDRLDELHMAFGLKPVYFFLLASRSKGVDRNLDPGRLDVQTLMRSHAERYLIGMHPSWQSGNAPNFFRAEKERLSLIIDRKVFLSRQHYLRMHLPETYRRLIAEGITDDFSMGYGTINGFRASISRPFPWYDLQEERETSLMVHPFCFMDANAFHELRMSPEDALRQLDHYLQILHHVGGCMSTIFHNSMLGTDPLYVGWYDMYVRFLQEVAGESHTSGHLTPR